MTTLNLQNVNAPITIDSQSYNYPDGFGGTEYGSYGPGVDVVLLGTAGDKLDGTYWSHAYAVGGNGGDDEIRGSVYSDTLNGGSGSDQLWTGGGSDTLTGGADGDVFGITIWGQNGFSTISDGTSNTISDFSTGDVLDFSSIGVTSYADLASFASSTGSALEFRFWANGYEQVIRLNGVTQTLGQLGAASFAFSTSVNGGYFQGTESRDDLFGTNGGDTLIGLGDVDRIFGGGGNDTIDAGAGADIVFAGGGTDDVRGGADGDAVDAGAGNDTVQGDDGADSIEGGDGNDNLYGEVTESNWSSLWNDVISGGAGADQLAGGGGDDTLTGGADADTFRLDYVRYQTYGQSALTSNTLDTVTDFTASDRIDVSVLGISEFATARSLLGAQNDGLLLTVWINGYRTEMKLTGPVSDPNALGAANFLLSNVTQDESIYGSEARDDLFGGRGDDTLNGNGDVDRLFGESGNDTISGGLGDDLVSGGGGTDVIDAGKDDDVVDAGDGKDNVTGGEGTDQLAGGLDDDLIVGDDAETNWQQAFSDTLDGGGGNDTLGGGAGNDQLTGGAGADAFRLSFGRFWSYEGQSLASDTTDTVTDFDPTADRIDLSEARISDVETVRYLIEAQDGASAVVAYQNGYKTVLALGALVDKAALTANNVVLSRDTSADSFGGTEERDDLFGGLGNDGISGLGGTDRIFGENGNDTLDGGDGNDLVLGGGGTDKIEGGANNDALGGGAGLDTVTGGTGADALTGGGDADTLIGDLATTSWNQVYNDTLDGGDGGDLLAGGAGNDQLTGGAGADAFRVSYNRDGWNALSSDTVDTVTDWSAEDRIDVSEMGITEFDTLRQLLTLTTSGVVVLSQMSGYRNVLLLKDVKSAASITADNVVLDANDDANDNPDSVSGGDKSDDFFVGGGDDNVSGGGGTDRIFGEAGNDTLSGGNGADFLSGSGGTDALQGESGNDGMLGGAGNDTVTGGNGADQASGGSGDDLIAGDTLLDTEADVNVGTDWSLSFDDVLAGDAGEDHLMGGAGDDTLTGGADGDTFQMAGSRTDNMIENSVDKVTDWSTAEDRIDLRELGIGDFATVQELISVENGVTSMLTRQNGFINRLVLGSEAGVGQLAAKNFVLSTSTSNDAFGGTVNADHEFGGRGNDSLSGNKGDDWLFGEIGNDTLDGGAGEDRLFGGAGTDSIEGGDGTDEIRGGAGNDVVSGGAGSDNLSGGGGADDFVMGAWTGFIDELNDYGKGSSKGGAVILDFSVADKDQIDLRELHIENFSSLEQYFFKDLGDDGAIDISLYGFTQRITIKGLDSLAELGRESFIFDTSKVADRYVGSIVADIIALGAGNDTASGGLGNDVIAGESGVDTLSGGAGADKLDGGVGDDKLAGDAGNDTILAGDGADMASGGAGNDAISGGAGNDTIMDGAGADKVDGGAGTDTVDFLSQVVLDLTKAANSAGEAADTSYKNVEVFDGSAAADDLTGGKAADTFLGDAGNDDMLGMAGNDKLNGETGNDMIAGGAGLDSLTGGGGDDTFLFDAAMGKTNVDTITDFNKAGNDTIALDASTFGGLVVGQTIRAQDFFLGTKAADKLDRVIYDAANGDLFYDADGSGAKAAVQIADLAKGLKLTIDDFEVVL